MISKWEPSGDESKDYPRIGIDELRERVTEVTHYRERAILVIQLKLGLRAGEVANIQLRDVSIDHNELRRHYPEMGTHEMLEGRDNAIYIPPGDHTSTAVQRRKGNKSGRPRILPLDDETRRTLLRYLLVRPQVDEPWLLLTKKRYNQLDPGDPGRAWKTGFRPDYDETDRHRAIASHFGRHYFTTHWAVHEDLNPELVGYMRGDMAGSSVEDHGSIHHYIHTYYADIEQIYRERIFKLFV